MAQVTSIDCRVAPFDWPFAREEAERVDAHWAVARAEKPGLFDGRVLMFRDLAVDADGGGTLCGGAFEVRFRNFLSWRDFGFPDRAVANVFGMPALLSADGAFMLGRMSKGTANASRLYFPAGTPEPADAGPGGRVDFDANILRELEEETGLSAAEVTLGPTWTIVFAGPLVGCMKIARSPLTGAELCRRAADFIETQQDPELDGLIPVKSPADFDPASMPSFIVRYLARALAEPELQAR